MNFTLMVLGMALITFAIKAAIFILGERASFPPLLRRALSFVPVTVLTAIIVPMVLAPQDDKLAIGFGNPQLVASIVAILVCAVTGRQLLTIVLALLTFFGWQMALL